MSRFTPGRAPRHSPADGGRLERKLGREATGPGDAATGRRDAAAGAEGLDA